MMYIRVGIAPNDSTFESKEEGEKRIVNLIHETRMGADAKIDLEKVSL
jgi:hypothetical protein